MEFCIRTVVFLALSALGLSLAQAEVAVNQPWARATVEGQPSTGAFMELKADADTRLVAADSAVADQTQIHEMAMQNDIMRMRQISGLDLPAGKTVKLAPGGNHVMLLGLKQQLKEGEHIVLKLVFERGGQRETQTVNVPVRALTAGPPAAASDVQPQGHQPQGHQQHGQQQHGHQQHGMHAPAAAVAAGDAPAQVSVQDCWVRAMPGNLPSAAYFKVRNGSDQAIALTGVRADAFGHAMLHATREEGGMAKMVHAGAINIPAGGEFAFTPQNGYHAMLEQAKQTLEAGSAQTLSFTFDRGGPLAVSCTVRPPSAL
jgi:copper(I)-binding protein